MISPEFHPIAHIKTPRIKAIRGVVFEFKRSHMIEHMI